VTHCAVTLWNISSSPEKVIWSDRPASTFCFSFSSSCLVVSMQYSTVTRTVQITSWSAGEKRTLSPPSFNREEKLARMPVVAWESSFKSLSWVIEDMEGSGWVAGALPTLGNEGTSTLLVYSDKYFLKREERESIGCPVLSSLHCTRHFL